jgi:structural maintenance of chromosome 4
VQNVPAGEAVIEYMKTKKIGRVSCIILDKISYLSDYMHIKNQDFPNAIRVFDMVKPKSQNFAVAFYFIFRNTLYVKDSDLGLQYSLMQDDKNRRRVIS